MNMMGPKYLNWNPQQPIDSFGGGEPDELDDITDALLGTSPVLGNMGLPQMGMPGKAEQQDEMQWGQRLGQISDIWSQKDPRQHIGDNFGVLIEALMGRR